MNDVIFNNSSISRRQNTDECADPQDGCRPRKSGDFGRNQASGIGRLVNAVVNKIDNFTDNSRANSLGQQRQHCGTGPGDHMAGDELAELADFGRAGVDGGFDGGDVPLDALTMTVM
jgi:hypothetical protein